jgi:lipopolysaccharide cholinephosphotransferase
MRTKVIQHEFRPSFKPNEGVWIDIFPLVGSFADPTEQRKHDNGTHRSYTMSLLCSCGFASMRDRAFPTVLRGMLVYPYARLRGYRHWLRRYDRFLDEYPSLSDSSKCVVPPFNSSIFDTEGFAETIQVEFEGATYPAPAGYDAILRAEYGDYMQPPPEDKRIRRHNFTATWR